jgi:hypothetical protein
MEHKPMRRKFATADHALSLLGNMRFPMFMAIDQGRRTRMKKVMKLGTSRQCSREMLLAWHFTIFSGGVDEHAKKPIIEGRLGLWSRGCSFRIPER